MHVLFSSVERVKVDLFPDLLGLDGANDNFKLESVCVCGREGWLWGSVPSVLGHVLSIHKALSFMASIKTERKWGIREEKGESRDQQEWGKWMLTVWYVFV